jgi:hypothetical protein
MVLISVRIPNVGGMNSIGTAAAVGAITLTGG